MTHLAALQRPHLAGMERPKGREYGKEKLGCSGYEYTTSLSEAICSTGREAWKARGSLQRRRE